MERRTFIKTALAGAGAVGLGAGTASAAEPLASMGAERQACRRR